jgi:DNA primase
MYVYVFYLPDSRLSIKVYRPRAEKKMNKWRANTGKSIHELQGYDQLPKKGKLLIITKAMKDVMALYSLGYTAIAPHGEGMLVPDDQMKDLQKRFKRVVVLYDNDETGTKNGNKLARQFECSSIFLPEGGPKDISDFIKENGADEALKQLKILLCSTKISSEET